VFRKRKFDGLVGEIRGSRALGVDSSFWFPTLGAASFDLAEDQFSEPHVRKQQYLFDKYTHRCCNDCSHFIDFSHLDAVCDSGGEEIKSQSVR